MSNGLSGGVVLLIVILAFTIYFLPCIIAGFRNKLHGSFGLFLLNLLLGWTVVGWFGALIWASSGKTVREEQAEQQRHAEMMALLQPRADNTTPLPTRVVGGKPWHDR